MTNENVDFASIMQQAQQMQEQMVAAQADQATKTLIGKSGGGQVQVEVNGNGEFQKVSISPEVINPEDAEMLEDLILAAVRDASTQVNEIQIEALNGLGIPELDEEEQ